MTRENRLARLAGLLYLLVVAFGVFRLVYVPAQIVVSDDIHATINRIVGSEFLFRLGIASALVEQVAFLLLSLVLFRLLHTVDKPTAVFMVVLVVVSVSIALAGLSNQLNVLALLSEDRRGQLFAPGLLELLVKQSFDAYDNGLLITELFWGLWLFPFGYLVFKSRLAPESPWSFPDDRLLQLSWRGVRRHPLCSLFGDSHFKIHPISSGYRRNRNMLVASVGWSTPSNQPQELISRCLSTCNAPPLGDQLKPARCPHSLHRSQLTSAKNMKPRRSRAS